MRVRTVLLWIFAPFTILACSSDDLIGPTPVAGGGLRPAVATNGLIAFTSDRDGNREIYTMNADGTGQTNRTNNLAYDDTPAWSPNGTQIAFTSDRDGDSEIYVMDATTIGGSQTKLTNNADAEIYPAWSPDGAKIAFTSTRDFNYAISANDYEIYVMNANGSGQTNLSNNAAYDDDPAWSPDGTQIAFTTIRGNAEIYVMNAADGSNPTNLSNHGGADFDPAWSPDGTMIAFYSSRLDSYEIYVMNAANGSGQTRLTNNVDLDYWPSWGPVSNQPPETTITAAEDGNGAAVSSGGSTPSNSITFTFVGADDHGVVGFECSLDAVSYAACSSLGGYSSLAIGSHSFAVRALDTAGEADGSPASFHWTVATAAQASQMLLNDVESLNLPTGVAKRLSAPLNQALSLLGDVTPMNDKAAGVHLAVFINQDITLMQTGQLTPSQGNGLLPSAYAINNSLWTPLGDPVSGIVVSLEQILGGVVQTKTTDAYGEVVFDNLAAGQYVLELIRTSPSARSLTLAENHNSSRSNKGNIVGSGGSTEVTVNFELVSAGPKIPDMPVPLTIGAQGGRVEVAVTRE